MRGRRRIQKMRGGGRNGAARNEKTRKDPGWRGAADAEERLARCSVPFFIIIRIFFCLFLYISFEEDPTAQRPRKEEAPLDGNGILAFFQGILGQMQPCCQLQEQRRLRFCFLPLFTPKFPLGFAYLEVGGDFFTRFLPYICTWADLSEALPIF